MCSRTSWTPARARNPRLVYARMTGWGQDGPLARASATTSTTSRSPACCGTSAPKGDAARAADQPARRLRRRRRARRHGHPRRARRTRAGPGEGQMVDAAMVDGSAQLMSIFFGIDAIGTLGRRAARTSSTAARTSTTSTRPPTASTSSIARTSRSSTSTCSAAPRARRPRPRAQMDRAQWPATQGALRRAIFATRDPRRVGRVLRGHRGLLRAGAAHERSTRAPAQRRTRDLHRRRRRTATRHPRRASRAQPARCGGRPSPGQTPTPCSSNGASTKRMSPR